MRWVRLLLCALSLAAAANADPIMVAPGIDPFHAGQFTTAGQVALPADFFNPGSDPFLGTIIFVGLPAAPLLGSSNANVQLDSFSGNPFLGPVPMGPQIPPGADTVIQRLGPANLPDGGSDSVPIEIVALNLVSVQPIVVTSNGGLNPTPWNVHFDLPVPAPGSMTLTRNGSTLGGTFDATLPIQYRLIFTPLQPSTAPNPFLLNTDVIQMEGTWEVVAVPEPSTWLLASIGLAALAGRASLRRRRP